MYRFLLSLLLILPGLSLAAAPEVHINVARQELFVMKEGQAVAKYKISTSIFGLGDEMQSYKTPVGAFVVSGKKGDKLPLGAVLKKGRPTGEILRPNARGRDPIVTRVITLRGLEKQNKNAKARGIWIHGTPQEKHLGKPMSWGCIRMRSKDVVQLYDVVTVGTRVTIQDTSQPSESLRSNNPFSWVTKMFQSLGEAAE